MPNLNLPTPGTTPGPQWANMINTALSALATAVDNAGSSGSSPVLVLGPTESIPAGTPANTLIVRRTS